ncbi:MAG: hypothetical protein GTN80_08710 [Nitrososphaeria archaeon]|nr:hypothetical protein [Nitrososphaeria archaeon]NIQ33700.1 hypothetical protein [Nitrososphaeria archaeon]
MDVKEAVVRIFRFDPWVDDEPRYETFKIPYREGDRILDVLLYIQENIDPTLAFRHSCKIKACITCYLKLDGKVRLACQERAREEMTLEPWDKYRVIRDLVVDLKPP